MRRLALLFTATLLLVACQAQSLPLPTSQKLSPEKVARIGQTIEQQYPKLSAEQRDQLLRSVVRSLDDMVFVEGGQFEMGDFGWICNYDETNMCTWPCGQDPQRLCPITGGSDDNVVHPVKLSSYHLSKYQARMGDFDLSFIARGIPLFDAEYRERENMQLSYAPKKPAFTQTWQEAKDYCQWLGQLSGYPVDLPTEAQWEYAARSRGQYLMFSTDNGGLDFDRNFPDDNKEKDTFAVDRFVPNPLGIYNMSGNATDWVNDWYGADYYRHSPLENPQGPATGTLRIRRGSNYIETALLSANTVRRWAVKPDQGQHLPSLSFRCAIQSAQPL